MSAPDAVLALVERFSRQQQAYRSGEYNEARLRREFLDPFFSELGWDMDNRRGYAEAYKDVIHEDSIRVGAGTKAPDYCFRIATTRKFFVEAKRPAVNIKDDISPAYQLRRYAWTAKLPLSILTDFEEFAVYDCRVRPYADDKASVSRTMYMTWEEYSSNWDEIAGRFSREAILRGSFDAYADAGKGRRGTTEVDDAFLEEIERWRELLAKNLAEKNGSIGQSDLNFAVQRTIDRIVFLRICEDRGIEEYGRLQSLAVGPGVYKRLCERFFRADERYNSGLFHFKIERGRAGIQDELTQRLVVDDKTLREILESLYYPTSPYEFSVLPSDILGQVYERFLGKVIRLTPSHRAKIEEKPEVRKAGGVYYTPAYIVDYLVKATIAPQLVGRSSESALSIRVLDPACGSGSFLLGAYQFLLDWHLTWFAENDPEKWARRRQPAIFRGRKGDWRLTGQFRKQILLCSIFGVDVDAQAVEVTKLSLLLKVLEGETEESLNAALKLFHDRALPDLGRNIRAGNSLISPDSSNPQLRLALEGESDASPPFDWQSGFPNAFAAGGFDAVIGNPPYLSYAGRQSVDIPQWTREYFSKQYESGGWPTAHSLFLERSVKALSRGMVGFIVPDQVGHLGGYGSLREVLTREAGLIEVRYWGEHVFRGVITPALTLVLDKSARGAATTVFSKDGTLVQGTIQGARPWSFSPALELIERLRQQSFSLGKVVGDCGIRTTSAKDQVVPLADARGRFLPALEGKRINRFVCAEPEIAVRLDSRKDVFVSDEGRYRSALFLIRQTASYPIVGPHDHAVHFRNSLLALFAPPPPMDVRYVVGLLNSKLIRFLYISLIREAQQRTFPQVKVGALQTLPIRSIDFVDALQVAAHDNIVQLVQRALDVSKRIASEKNPIRAEALGQSFRQVDRQLDTAVYAIYGLAASEIEMVERTLDGMAAPTETRAKSWRPETGPVAGPKRGRARNVEKATGKLRTSG